MCVCLVFFFFSFNSFLFLKWHEQDCLKRPRRWMILEAVLLSTQRQMRMKMLWNRESRVCESDHRAQSRSAQYHNTTHAQGGGLAAEKLPDTRSHQLFQLAGPAPDLTSSSVKYDKTQQSTDSKLWVWELEPPELPWCCGAVLQGYRHGVPSMFQLLHLLQQLEETTQMKLPAYYQALLLSLAALTDVVSTPLILFFWQPLLMTSLEGNSLKNCLFHSMLPLYGLSTANINWKLLFLL